MDTLDGIKDKFATYWSRRQTRKNSQITKEVNAEMKTMRKNRDRYYKRNNIVKWNPQIGGCSPQNSWILSNHGE